MLDTLTRNRETWQATQKYTKVTPTGHAKVTGPVACGNSSDKLPMKYTEIQGRTSPSWCECTDHHRSVVTACHNYCLEMGESPNVAFAVGKIIRIKLGCTLSCDEATQQEPVRHCHPSLSFLKEGKALPSGFPFKQN